MTSQVFVLTYHIVGVGQHGLREHVGLLQPVKLELRLDLGGGLPLGGLAPVPVRVIVGTQVLIRLAVRQQAETYNVLLST